MAYFQKLKDKWGITSNFQIAVILVVFSCTGFSVLYLEELIAEAIGLASNKAWYIRVAVFIFLTLPLYNILLLVWGFILGQFRFFWNYEKMMLVKIRKLFAKKTHKPE
jgi:Family of unknown function (DUF6787)